MLASRAVEAALVCVRVCVWCHVLCAQSSRDPDTVTSGRALELILLVESLQVCLSRTDMSPGGTYVRTECTAHNTRARTHTHLK